MNAYSNLKLVPQQLRLKKYSSSFPHDIFVELYQFLVYREEKSNENRKNGETWGGGSCAEVAPNIRRITILKIAYCSRLAVNVFSFASYQLMVNGAHCNQIRQI